MQKKNEYKCWFAAVSVAGIVGTGCNEVYQQPQTLTQLSRSVVQAANPFDSALLDHSQNYPFTNKVYTGETQPDEVLSFARTLMGTPYVWGATDPAVGFDCSGFITYVFNHFGIQVPRTTIFFANLEGEVPLASARPGDLILFTGVDSATSNTIGHMGIIESNDHGQMRFIHATSGKAMGVTTSPFDAHYQKRFVKLIRVFPPKDSL